MSNNTQARTAVLIAQGWTNKQIAKETGRSEKTIKAHCTILYRRYNVTSRLQFALKFKEIERAAEQAVQENVSENQ